ncbi:MAG: hypothetical protein NTU60_09580 [Candidatus Aminicenantes bacterium]|nr:hypothetical protein [Candidatus Aminicenantes bacterium]
MNRRSPGPARRSNLGALLVLAWPRKRSSTALREARKTSSPSSFPCDLDKLLFDVTAPGGYYYELTFMRDEAGNITKCKLVTQGMELLGDRIKSG